MKFSLIPPLSLFLAISFTIGVSANIIVGVRQGDWVEYKVSFTGTPPIDHDAVWARMEVVGVDGNKVNATFSSRLANDTELEILESLDLESGRLIDMFIIPAELNEGESFYDKVVGHVVIDKVETRNYAGVNRAVVHAEAVDTQWYWDRATGVTLEARTANSVYTLDTVASGTNLWAPQILGLDENVFHLLVILVALGLSALVIVSAILRKKRRQTLS